MKTRRLRIHVPDWLKAIFLVVALFLIYTFFALIVNTIVFFLIGAIFAYILHPFVNWLTKQGIPRGLSVIIVLVIAVLLIILFVAMITPSLISQVREFVKDLPRLAKSARAEYDSLRRLLPASLRELLPADAEKVFDSAVSTITAQSQKIVSLVPSIISGIAGAIVIFIFAIYILVFLEDMDGWLRFWIPDQYHWLYDRFVAKMDIGYSRYIIGQLIVSVTYGLAVGLVSAGFGLPFPIILGFWAGIVQIIPVIGPVIALIPPLLLAFLISIRTGIIVAAILIAITGVQGVFVTPYILGATVTISPIIVLFFIIAGAEIGGIGGTILAVPFLVALNLVWQFINENFYYKPAPPPETPPTMIEMQPPGSPPEEEERPKEEKSKDSEGDE